MLCSSTFPSLAVLLEESKWNCLPTCVHKRQRTFDNFAQENIEGILSLLVIEDARFIEL